MWDRRRVAAAFVIAVVASASGTMPAAAGAPQFTFDVTIGSGCVTGTGLPNTAHVVSLYTSSGRLKDRDRVTTTGRAYQACFFQPILGRDQLVIVSGGRERSFRVPALTPVIDRVGDVVTGQAKAGSTVELVLFHGEGFDPAQQYPKTAVANANGTYTADFATPGILGADRVQAFWINGHDSVRAEAFAPFITYGRVSSTVVGSATRGTDVRVSIVDRDGDVRGVAHGGMPTVFQYFEAVFIDADGNDVFPQRGDRVVAPFTGDASLRVPRMFLAADPQRDRVAGSCMPNSPFQLWVFYGQPEPVVRIGMTDANGEFSRSVDIDLQRSHLMTLNCRYASGDFVFLDQEA